MKLAMAMNQMVGEEESHRRQEIQTRLELEAREKARERFRRQLAVGTRKTFVFLIGAIIVVFVVSHRMKISSIANQKINQVAAHVKAKAEASPLRKSALNYEKEVDEIISK